MRQRTAIMGLVGVRLAASALASPVVVGPSGQTGTVDAAGETLPSDPALLSDAEPASDAAIPPIRAESRAAWGLLQSEEERREVRYAILNQAELDLPTAETARASVPDAGGMDTQILSGVLFGQEKPEPKVVIPVGKGSDDRPGPFDNVPKASLFNLAFAFIVLLVLALKARAGG